MKTQFGLTEAQWSNVLSITTIVLAVTTQPSCSSTPTPSARVLTYGFELEQCTSNAETCEASIACENEVRKRYNRPLRDAAKGCK